MKNLTGKNGHITMLHGAGGSVMHDLVKNYIVKYFGNGTDFEVPLEALADAAVVNDIVLKSDSHAVKPIFFLGGDIGRLAVSGTVKTSVWTSTCSSDRVKSSDGGGESAGTMERKLAQASPQSTAIWIQGRVARATLVAPIWEPPPNGLTGGLEFLAIGDNGVEVGRLPRD